MTNQINLRFAGQANFSQVQAQLAALEKQFAAVQAASLKASGASAADFRNTARNLDLVRNKHVDAIKSWGDVDVRQQRAISSTEQYTKRLKDQKVHIFEAMKQHKMYNKVVKEQIDLQRAQILSSSRMADGRVVSEMFIPRDAVKRSQMLRTQLGVMNELLRSGAENMVKWGKNTQWAGRQLMVGFTLPLALAAAATGKLAYDMDKAMTKITKVYGDANSQFQDTSEEIRAASWKTAKNMSDLYGQSAKDTLEITAQFAAAGATGAELQQATAAATKARMLNEMDLQAAIQASISLQTVYGLSSEELGQTWEYINAVSNQTILSAEDFAIAIPKVSGLLKELGADVKDVGVFMTAMAAGGIEAAEGANALKTIAFRAVAPYDRGIETFNKNTGANLKDLVAQANGQIVPLLDLMIEKMMGLDAATKTQVFKDVFGIHQGNKALILMNQLADGGGQVAQAIAVGENSIAENAAIANQELARMNEQPYKKIEKAIQNIKNEMAELGKVVLPIINWVLEAVQGLLAWVNGLDDGKKIAVFAAAAFMALIGPATMLLGLFANLAGQIGKFGTIIGGLITQFKFLTPEQKAQELLAKQAASAYDVQTGSVARLTLALQEMAAAMHQTAAAGRVVQKATKPQQMGVVPEGQYFVQRYKKDGTPYPSLSSGNAQGKGPQVSQAQMNNLHQQYKVQGQLEQKEHARLQLAQQQNAALAAQQKRYQGLVAGAAGATMTLGILGTMFGPSEGIGATISKTLIGVGLLATIMPGLIAKFVLWGKTAVMSSNLVVTSLVRVRTAAVAAGTAMKMAALPLTLLAAGIALFWYKAKKDGEEAAEQFKAIAESAETWGKILNFNTMDPGELVKQKAKNGQQATEGLAMSFKKANQEAAEAIRQSGEGRKLGEKWAIAINEGVKVKLAGGTADAAKQATRTALQIMGEGFSDTEFETNLNVRVNFDNEESIGRQAVAGVSQLLNKAASDKGSGWERWARDWAVGQNDLSALGKESAIQAADMFNRAYIATAADKRGEMFDILQKEQEQDIRKYYDRVKDEFGISYSEFFKEVSNPSLSATPASRAVQALGLGPEEMSQLTMSVDKMSAFAAELAKLMGITDKVGENPSWDALEHYLNKVNGEMSAGEGAGKAMSKGMQEAAEAADSLLNVLRDAGITNIDSEGITDKYRQIMEGTQGAMFDLADREWDAHTDAVMSNLDSAADAASERMERKQEALEERQEAAQDRLEKKQEDRKKAIEDYYDSRIKKIDAAVKAEQDAEAMRQKLFEAEKTRLQRYSTMFSKNIDFNAAISGGNLDEAAKIANDMQAQTDTWNLEDADAAAGDASAKRQAALDAQKAKLEAQKDARLEALKAIEDAEDKALENRQKREDKALKASIDADKKRMDNLKANRQRELEDDKRLLDIKLATIRAYIPRNAAEMKRQQDQIAAAYKEFGVTFNTKGKEWSKIIGTSFKEETKKASNQIKTEVAWKSIGNDISNQLLKGGFGMTAKQFATWMNGGAAPSGTLFNPKKPVSQMSLTEQNDRRHSHTGSIAGVTEGKRTGWSGKNNSQSEIDVTVLKGQGILTRKATDMIGQENILNLNKGKLPEDTGPWGPTAGIAGLAAAMQGAALKRVMSATMNAVQQRMLGGAMDGAKAMAPGKYGGFELTAEQLRNAATIMATGRSMGASQRDLTIGLMTAMQESSLRNLGHGDRDSLGLFQQRPSQGWGSAEDIMNPDYAARKFFAALFNVKDRDSLPMTVAAQKVQRSAYPTAYAKWQNMAQAIVSSGGVYKGFGANIDIAGMMGGALGAYGGAPGAGGWVKPASGRVTSEYGMRKNPVTGIYKLHGGIDIGAATGTPIYASKRGQVTMAGYYPSVGNYVRVDHGNGIQTGYAHQSKIRTKVGALVNAGQRLGDVGTTGNSTGPHLHFEYWRNGSRQNPRQIIPAFAEGGYTLSTGLGMLHPNETVLSEPLTKNLHEGLNNFANGEGNRYDVTIDMRNSTIAADVDVKKAVNEALDERERRAGRSRRMGDNK